MGKRKDEKQKASEVLWRKMAAVSAAEKKDGSDPLKAAVEMTMLLREAYNKDLLLVIGSVHQPEMVSIHLPEMPKRPGMVAVQQSERVGQAYFQTELGRLYLVYTSTEEGEKRARLGSTWDVCSARDMLGNILNRKNVAGVAVDEVIIPWFVLTMYFPKKPEKPEGFVPEKQG